MKKYFASRALLVFALLVIGSMLFFSTKNLHAQQNAAVAISVKDYHFAPAELHAPANRPLAITVKNLDAAAIEFESVSLRVEKVIAPGSQGVVNVRPLPPGRYEFFDDFHQETRGTLIAE